MPGGGEDANEFKRAGIGRTGMQRWDNDENGERCCGTRRRRRRCRSGCCIRLRAIGTRRYNRSNCHHAPKTLCLVLACSQRATPLSLVMVIVAFAEPRKSRH
jgi:hypothetical protein